MESGSGRPGARLERAARRWRWLACAALVVVAGLSLMPPPVLPQAPRSSDKLAHVVLYALLMYCHARAYPRPAWRGIALGLVAYGILMEGLQHYAPLRSASVADAIANLAGITIMLVALTRPSAAARSP